jgi:hypothetical protein
VPPLAIDDWIRKGIVPAGHTTKILKLQLIAYTRSEQTDKVRVITRPEIKDRGLIVCGHVEGEPGAYRKPRTCTHGT